MGATAKPLDGVRYPKTDDSGEHELVAQAGAVAGVARVAIDNAHLNPVRAVNHSAVARTANTASARDG